jgi:hypothetical protein
MRLAMSQCESSWMTTEAKKSSVAINPTPHYCRASSPG